LRRLLTGALLIPVLLAVVKLAPPWAFFLLGLTFALVASFELCRLLRARDRVCLSLWAAAGTAALGASFLADPPALHLVMAALIVALPSAAMLSRRDIVEAADAALTTLFSACLLGLGFGFLVGLRVAGGDDELGQDLVLFCCVVIWLADSAAYYGGSTLGRRKLLAHVSPKKTWEGFFFGLAGSLVAAGVACSWFFRRLPLEHALALGALLFLAGVLGDLVESVQKRATGVKDSGVLLPGHGGALDRLDSLLFASPVAYLYYRLLLESL
jgi:phosphatidate cytidylyltransferase